MSSQFKRKLAILLFLTYIDSYFTQTNVIMLLASLQLMLVQHRTDQNYKAIDQNGVEQMMEHKNLFILMIIIWSFRKEKEALKKWLRTTVKVTWKMSILRRILTYKAQHLGISRWPLSKIREDAMMDLEKVVSPILKQHQKHNCPQLKVVE